MFYGWTLLENITFPQLFEREVKGDNDKNFSNMFNQCKSLKELNLSCFNKSKIEDINNIFSFCSKLQKISFSDSFDTKKVTDISNMFNECNSLIELNLSNYDTSNVINMKNMFYKCQSLKEVNLLSFNTPNVINMSNMFTNCNSIKNLDLNHSKLLI